jgi:hypothetical protein
MLLVSCKTSRQPASVGLQTMTKEERVSNMLQSEIQYDRLSSNLKLAIKPGKKNRETAVDAQLRIVKDEAIQLSLRMPILGSEVFKVLITPDNLLIIDRLNKHYLWESMQTIKDQAPFDFDFYSLEALFTNQLFIAGQKGLAPADYDAFQIQEDDFFVHLTYTDQQAIQYNFTGDYSHRIQTTQMEQSKWKSRLQCTYTDWGLTSDKRTFPMTMDMLLNTPEEVYNVKFSYKSVDINPDFTIDNAIPARYKQVTLQQVIKLIGSLL